MLENIKYENLTSENIEDFLSEVKTSVKEDEYGTIAHLRERIDYFYQDLQDEFTGELCSETKARMLVRVQVIAAYLLILGKTDGYEFQQKFLLLMEALCHLSPRSANALAQWAVYCLTGRISSLGYTWLDLTAHLSADIIAYKITSAEPNGIPSHTDSFEKKGSLCIKEGEISVSPYNKLQTPSLVKTFDILNEQVGLYVKDSRDERLKASEANSISSIEKFTDTFCANQNTCKPVHKETLKTYQEGDHLNVQITGITVDGEILVKSIDPSYKTIHGSIIDEELVVGLQVSQLLPYLEEERCFADVLLDTKNDEECEFSIFNSYVDYAGRQANFAKRNGILILAKATNRYGPNNKINWISYNGLGLISDNDPTVKIGDMRAMLVLTFKENGSGCYINSKIAGAAESLPDRTFDDYSVLKFYTKDLSYLMKDFVKPKIFEEASTLSEGAIRSLATILLGALNEGSSLSYYRSLCCARVLYTLIGDSKKAAYTRGKASFIKNCILFARGETISFPERDIEYNTTKQKTILSTLLCLGKHDREGALCALLCEAPQESVEARIARLILAKNTAILSDGDMGFSDAALRREVALILGVSDVVLDEDCADIPTGKYGNVERQFREFKSSYVYRNDDTGADFQKQGRDEVFQAVCGLLNTNGGQVYLGVNNNGDPIVDSSWGLSADIKWLKSNYVKINALRKSALGHNTCKVTDLDSYVNFLQDEKRIYFKDSVLDNIIIEPTEDADAICITVSPSEYELAYLYDDGTHTVGQIFRRDGNRTIPMTEVEKQKRLMKLQSIGKEIEFQIKIQEAIDLGKKIILKQYASSDCRDRFLAPICLLYGGESVWCVDLEDRGKPCKQFRLSRAQGVEVVDEKYPHGISPIESDIFRFTGEKKYHLKLSLSASAKNLLLEEYPMAAKLPEAEFYKVGEGKESRWILDTHIANIVGARRFIIGLADKVEILETEHSPEIKSNIREFYETTINPIVKE